MSENVENERVRRGSGRSSVTKTQQRGKKGRTGAIFHFRTGWQRLADPGHGWRASNHLVLDARRITQRIELALITSSFPFSGHGRAGVAAPERGASRRNECLLRTPPFQEQSCTCEFLRNFHFTVETEYDEFGLLFSLIATLTSL